jgi:divalent metal cation (Fe/Co/Zn/Cd) transporter
VSSYDDMRNDDTPERSSGDRGAMDFTLASDDVLEKAHAIAEQIQQRVRNLMGDTSRPSAPAT